MQRVYAVQRLVGQLPPPLSSAAQTRHAQWARAGLSTVGFLLNSEGRVEDSDAACQAGGRTLVSKTPFRRTAQQYCLSPAYFGGALDSLSQLLRCTSLSKYAGPVCTLPLLPSTRTWKTTLQHSASEKFTREFTLDVRVRLQ